MDNQAKDKINLLVDECKFDSNTAFAYVEFDGRCAYCGEDLVSSRHGYAIGTIDHLLPKGKYPDFEFVQENLILSCSLCNSIKSSVDLLNEEQRHNAKEILIADRKSLIGKAKNYIAEKINPMNLCWWKARQILRS